MSTFGREKRESELVYQLQFGQDNSSIILDQMHWNFKLLEGREGGSQHLKCDKSVTSPNSLESTKTQKFV